MKCQSGKHEWLDPISAERCCSGKWFRAIRSIGDHHDLDEKGRVGSAVLGFVYGWVRFPENVME